MKSVLILASLLIFPVAYAANPRRPATDITSLAPDPIKRRWSTSKSSKVSRRPDRRLAPSRRIAQRTRTAMCPTTRWQRGIERDEHTVLM